MNEQLRAYKKVRKTWTRHPATRIVPSKKHYTKLTKKEIEKILKEEDL